MAALWLLAGLGCALLLVKVLCSILRLSLKWIIWNGRKLWFIMASFLLFWWTSFLLQKDLIGSVCSHNTTPLFFGHAIMIPSSWWFFRPYKSSLTKIHRRSKIKLWIFVLSFQILNLNESTRNPAILLCTLCSAQSSFSPWKSLICPAMLVFTKNLLKTGHF